MGKMKIRLFPDGSIQMETEGIKGKKCADAKVYSLEKTEEYYQTELLLDEIQHLKDNQG